MGAGGIGGYVGGRLAASGEDVHLVARGAHLAAIRASGLRIESPHGDAHIPEIAATDDPSEIGPVDVVLFTVKLPDTEEAAAALGPMVAAHTRIITLQNGVDSADMLAEHADRAQIAPGIIYLAAYIKAPGIISNPGGVHRMTIDAKAGDPTMTAFFAACDKAVAIDAVPTDEPGRTIWQKFIALVAFSGVTSITRLPIGAIYENAEALAFMRALLEESIAVANAAGQRFEAEEADRILELFRNQPYDQRSSMLVDLEAGKALELPWLSGRVHELGQKHDIATPAHWAVSAALSPHVDGRPG